MKKLRHFYSQYDCGFFFLTTFSLFTFPNTYIIHAYFGSKVRPSDYFNMAIAEFIFLDKNLQQVPTKEKKKHLDKITWNLLQSIALTPSSEKELLLWSYRLLGRAYHLQNKKIKSDEAFEKARNFSTKDLSF